MNGINRKGIQKILHDKSFISGIICFIISVFILTTDFIDTLVTTILWPVLEGSSEGKTVMFLFLTATILVITPIIENTPELRAKLYKNSQKNHYLKYTGYVILIMMACAFTGLFIEAYIRESYNVSFCTILTSMNNITSTTSPMHSHIYKSVLGFMVNSFVPSHINTASSILNYGMPYCLIIIPAVIITYILGVAGITGMRPVFRYPATAALVLLIIGVNDGGLFSQPFLIGIFLMLIIYFSKGEISIKHLIKPVVIMTFILLIGVSIEIGGSDTQYHTLTVINQTQEVDVSSLDVINKTTDADKTIYILNTTKPDKKLIQEVFELFKGKCSSTFMSWNFYSYLENPTMKLRQEGKLRH